MTCPICQIRKPKRFCPAVHDRICPQCCGEQREVSLDCPSDCPYLQQARDHEKPRATGDLDAATLLLQVEVDDQFLYEHEHLIMGLSFALARSARHDRAVNDRDLIAALTSVARSYERLVNSGLHYDEPTQNPTQQAIAAELINMVKEYREAELKHTGYARLRDSEVLKTLVFLVRMAHARTSGRPRSRAYIDFLFKQFPETEPSLSSPAPSTNRIIVP
jgi:hypothetical protein